MDCYADKKNNMNSTAKCKVEKIIFKLGFYLDVIVSDNKVGFYCKDVTNDWLSGCLITVFPHSLRI